MAATFTCSSVSVTFSVGTFSPALFSLFEIDCASVLDCVCYLGELGVRSQSESVLPQFLNVSSSRAVVRHVCTNTYRGNRQERARLRMFEGEPFYGVQIATNVISEALTAIDMAANAGAAFVDLNCGCPIHGAVLASTA
jgi:hypothetical protein